jgi:large subunit ribosomal protein L23
MSLFNKATTTKDAPTANIKPAEAKKASAPSMKELYGNGSPAEDRAKSGKKKPAKAGGMFTESYRIIVRPLITEKATHLGKQNQYAFVVASQANKITVARAVEALYGVKPSAVNMVNVSGKQKRTGRTLGRRKNWKKAIITLPKGKSIQIYEGV